MAAQRPTRGKQALVGRQLGRVSTLYIQKKKQIRKYTRTNRNSVSHQITSNREVINMGKGELGKTLMRLG